MSRHHRWNRLLEMLAERGSIEVETAAEQLGVSRATLRRDLASLEQQQMVTRTHGGAVSTNVAYDLPLRYKAARRAPEKQQIAAAAAAMVRPAFTVGLNGGTTTTEVARALAVRTDLNRRGGDAGVTIVTNAVNIANELTVRAHAKVVVTGGVARQQSYELIGSMAEFVLERVSLDIAFLGVDGIDDTGITTHHEEEARINELLARRAAKVVVVADSTKLGRRSFARICPIDAIHVLITDAGATHAQTAPLAAAGVEVVRAG